MVELRTAPKLHRDSIATVKAILEMGLLVDNTEEFGFKEAARRFSCANLQQQTASDPASFSKRNRLSGSNSSLQSLDGKLLQRKPIFPIRKCSAGIAPKLTKLNAKNAQQPISQAIASLKLLPKSVKSYVEEKALLTNCKNIHICDGSEFERNWLIKQMAEEQMIKPLKKHQNCWLARTDPRDVARVESKTFICTSNKHDVIPRGCDEKNRCSLGNWMHVDELEERMSKLLPNCMSGRTMFVIPFSMGPLGSNLSKIGIQLTDSPYVVVSMHIMTRVSRRVLEQISSSLANEGNDFVRCFHSVGCPLPLSRPLVNNWPCNPDETIITHIPQRKEIISFGSGYGGNSLLGKKCFALRLGSLLGLQEGWLAEHMMIVGVTNLKTNQKKYIAAAFPSACGKTNLAMLTPTLPGYKVECVGDDIAWMRFDENGLLRAINPESGFFGVAPGTSNSSNPNAMKTIEKNTIFTNVAETADGSVFWEGLNTELLNDNENSPIIDWQNQPWTPQSNTPAAHPNSRFCAPASQCPIIDPDWESCDGVPISAIIFGGRRPEGVPLVYESFDWNHGIFVGASMRSESTAAAEHKGKIIMHDPFAMRPFFGYNFGEYLKHWLKFGKRSDLKLPKIFHVNWFRRDLQSGKFLWPGFGENIRVLDWICRRVDGQDCSVKTPIGLVPSKNALNLDGLEKNQIETDKLFSIDQDFWLDEQKIIEHFLRNNAGLDLPTEMLEESKKLKQRLEQMR